MPIIVHHLILIIAKLFFLLLGEGPIDDINDSISAAEKKFSIIFSKVKTKLCLSLHYNGDDSYLFVNKKAIYKFKADKKCQLSNSSLPWNHI